MHHEPLMGALAPVGVNSLFGIRTLRRTFLGRARKVALGFPGRCRIIRLSLAVDFGRERGLQLCYVCVPSLAVRGRFTCSTEGLLPYPFCHL